MRWGDAWKLRPKERLYIACEDMDLSFTRREIFETIRMWGEGVGVEAMAAALNRDADELLILLIDLARQGRILPRRGGIVGEPLQVPAKRQS